MLLQNHEQVVRALLEAKANIEAKANSGKTSLMLSAENGHEQVCSHRPQTVTDVSGFLDVTTNSPWVYIYEMIFWGIIGTIRTPEIQPLKLKPSP